MIHRIRSQHGPAGFTLVELMVAVALSGIVIGFVFQIHNQMVGALRGQANLSEVVETVTAAREMLAREVRVAGMGFPATGVKFGAVPDVDVWRGIDAVNDVDGAGSDMVDSLAIQRTEGDIHDSQVVDDGTWYFSLPGADTMGFTTTLPVMIETATGDFACAANPTVIDNTGIHFDITINDPGSPCHDGAAGKLTSGTSYRLARIERIGFRLDPGRLDLGVLQRATDGGAWEDLGIGFSNLQIAVRFIETGDAVDADGDGDPTKDWYSGDVMEVGNVGRLITGAPVQVGLSIEGRNLRPLDKLASSATPAYTDPTLVHPDNNPLGNWGVTCAGAQYDPCGVDLTSGTPPPRYNFPEHIYRSSSTTVWLRERLDTL